MNANLYGADGVAKGFVELPASVFGVEVNTSLLHSVVVGYLANQRQGTAKTKSRAEVSGGGRKPWRQKGTGRARSGSNTSPVWARGGKAHGALPRDYESGVSRKMRRKALACALTLRAEQSAISVVEAFSLVAPKTSVVSTLLENVKLLGKKILLVLPADSRVVYLSSRNIRDLNVKSASDINAYDVMQAKSVVFVTEEVIATIEEVVTK